MGWPWKKKETRLDIAIDKAYDEFDSVDYSDRARVDAIISSVTRLEQTRREAKRPPVSWDTILIVATHIVVVGGIALLELKGHSLTSRALSFKMFKP